MRSCRHCRVEAIASRDEAKAETAARSLNIPRHHTSYEALLEDAQIDAVYIPLPNHLHLPWSIRALQAGKHVLCEKPIALSVAEVERLIGEAERHPGLLVMEAFMYRHHPRWEACVERVRSGEIGELKTIHSLFSYRNDDPGNIRNRPDMGGGGVMDIGCYSISLSRLLFGRNPVLVRSLLEIDPEFGVDRLASVLLEFPGGHSLFTCATRQFRHQQVTIFGTEGMIEMESPFNPPTDRTTRLLLRTEAGERSLEFEPCNQFAIQADRFSLSILEKRSEPPVPLRDALENMEVIEQALNEPEP